ncbi:hypothetical protein [Lactiplantibacillus plantarum]|uniref:hypothetical protein n=1 Tax=Lactiplantibacillus plantarum TaxID=1590 RepID=UPI00223801F6|nr:hypothetical protein [Lactiplantibacillus plantarum]MCW6101533.1 hypothetical protein [Lactiplantibacillus plantarum]MCW6104660.1 hypothetical protein [Lactiplantibacillus plantarum]
MNDITQVFVVKREENDWAGKKLAFDNAQLGNLVDSITLKDSTKLPSFDDAQNGLSPAKKFYIKTDDNAYQLEIIESLYTFLTDENIDLLQESADLINDNYEFTYDFIVYVSQTENRFVGAIFPFKKTLVVKEKTFLSFKRHLADTNANSLKITAFGKDSKAFQLPDKENICTFYRNVADGNQIFKIDIFDVFLLDGLLKMVNIRNEYANRTLDRFQDTQDPLTLTTDDIGVNFQDSPENSVRDAVHDSEDLANALGKFSGSRHYKIQNISQSDLSNVLKEIEDFVRSDASANFTLNDIPKLENNTLIITPNSVPIFSALLENRVIKRLLNGFIEIPYYR